MTLFDDGRDAFFDKSGKYRYWLRRTWDVSKPTVAFIGLNPPTANHLNDDPTIKRVIQISKHNGFGKLYMLNCFTYVTAHPDELENDFYDNEFNNSIIQEIASRCAEIVFAWGNFKVVAEYGRDKELAKMFPKAKALAINKNGSPKHPLYCKVNSLLIPYNP